MQLQVSDPYGPYYSSLYSPPPPRLPLRPHFLLKTKAGYGGGVGTSFYPKLRYPEDVHAYSPLCTSLGLLAGACTPYNGRTGRCGLGLRGCAGATPGRLRPPCRAACRGEGGGGRGGERGIGGGVRNAGPYKGYFIRKPVHAWGAWSCMH
jgi:hypothetical protein